MTPIVYDSKKQTYQEISQECGRLLTASGDQRSISAAFTEQPWQGYFFRVRR